MSETKGRSKDGRIGVSLAPEVAQKLVQMKEKLSKKFGFSPSASQVVEYLINTYSKENNNE